jgi:thymidylate kinase
LLDWLFDAACFYQAACEHLSERDIIVLEEAFCQQSYYLLAFHQNGYDTERLRQYLQATPEPDLVIAITLSPEDCEQRMHGRSKGVASDILTPLTVAQRLGVLEQRFNMYTDIATYFEQHGVPVLRIENSDHITAQHLLQNALIPSRMFKS